MMRQIACFILVCCLEMAACAAEQQRGEEVTVAPEVTDEILANPGMGWETFYRTSAEDENLPAWIPSTVCYTRYGWAELEPKQGEIDYAMLNKSLEDCRRSGQKLALRVMCNSPEPGKPYHPSWLMEVGGRQLQCDYEGHGPLMVPDLDDPVVLTRHIDFIKRLGQRYDGHRDLDHVDLGSVGWWGEWHMSGSKTCKMPTMENRLKIVDAYLASFKKTPLLMLLGDTKCLKYAAGHGAGWRADCLGDMGGFSSSWSHMREGYPTWIKEAGVVNVWKNAPVAWETCWDMRKWVAEDWPLRYIFNYALALHASYINNKSAPLPPDELVRAEVERFLRRLGYRLVLTELRHPGRVSAGGTLSLAMQWQNAGSAPCYRPYRLAYRLSNEKGYEKIFIGKITVNRWLPGSIEVFTDEFFKMPKDLPPGRIEAASDAIRLPDDMPTGSYVLSLTVVGEDTADPVVRLGIKGRDKDGWYRLSQIQVLK
jgi:hypothetical protein